jgi:hypothetical protein
VERPDALSVSARPRAASYSGLEREGAADPVLREKMSPGSERVLVVVNNFKKFLRKTA